MIRGFEEQTEALSPYELEELLPIITEGLKVKVGAERAVTNKAMCAGLKARNYQVSEARVRKVINYIRTHNLIPCLIATCKGYYISQDPKEIQSYIQTLKSREDAIRQVRNSFEHHLAHQLQLI